MKSRRAFLLSLPLATVGVASAQTPASSPTSAILDLDGPDSAKTIEEIKKGVLFAVQWKESTFAKRQYLFAVTSTGDGASFIDLLGWIYNRHFKEWRRIVNLKTRHLGNTELLIDEKTGLVSLKGAAYNEFEKVEVFRFDLRVTSDDAEYAK